VVWKCDFLQYYDPPGVKKGIQKQWHDNGVLARESKYEYGKLFYQKKFDRKGLLIFN
jgi:antitoxin component YwqK of YwqJK toxin-antitoxin module